MKKLALAVSVATIVAAPLAQAGSSLTGSLRYGVNINSNDDNAIGLQNYGSRIKMSGDTAIGSNTGYGKLELRLGGKKDDQVSGRTYAVGMKGDFGDISVGLQDTAFDAVNSGGTDISWWNGANEGPVGDQDEKHGAILYKKSFGGVALALGAALQAGEDDLTEDVDVFDISVKYSNDALTLGVGMQSKEFGAVQENVAEGIEEKDARTGTATSIHGAYNFGAATVKLTYGIEDEDFTGEEERTGLFAQASYGDFYGFYGQSETDTGPTPTNIGVGYTQTLSDQSLIWYELFSTDADEDNKDAVTSFNAAYKLDF